MPHITLPIKFLLAAFFGAVIGLERESAYEFEKSTDPERMGHLGGPRTYALISLLGAIAGFLSIEHESGLFLAIAVAFFTLIAIYYGIGSILTRSAGLTTELGAVFAFLIGFFATSEILPMQITIAILVIVSLILSLKEKSKSFMLGIHRKEIDAFIGFAIVALVILPFLPNQSFYLTDIPAVQTMLSAYHVELGFLGKLEIINPFKLWFIVALITGIDILGYLLQRVSGGKKGILLASSIGGFISSTSTTQSLAQQSKKGGNINQLVSAAIFANLTSFLQVFVLVAPLNSAWLVQITPVMMLIIAAALIAGVYLYTLHSKYSLAKSELENKGTKEDKIFSLRPAVKFAILLIFIRIITKTALAFFGESGFLLSSVIASFSGIDAIVINLAEIAGKNLTADTALFTLLAVNATNLLSKSVYTFFQGDREFAKKFLFSMLIIILASFGGYLFI